ncbi:peptidoglycan DD-metalloendopeptidase family protein [Planosporangium mesophilum]|nr:peptidoglycan DD-metalloendopeptidase family protein [Planosporangium mesophilum]NJC85594.1 peptidoglycan DD-metalloendopeptidase family protein [Planosporangium mesophilum]
MARPLTRVLCAVVIAAGAAAAAAVGGNATAAAATTTIGTVFSGGVPLNVRVAPSTSARVATQLRTGNRVILTCQTTGPWINGDVRSTNVWDRTGNGNYVSNAYIRRPWLPSCPAATVPQPNPSNSGWVIPVPGSPVQLFRPVSNPTHDGVDIMQPRNTPIVAASAGRVVTVECNTSGSTCDVDGSPSVRGCGWYMEIQHANQVITRYCHLVRKPLVSEGQQVAMGQTIGYVGTSGNSSGPHLHFEVHVGPGYATRANAVDPVGFMQKAGAPLGVLAATRR